MNVTRLGQYQHSFNVKNVDQVFTLLNVTGNRICRIVNACVHNTDTVTSLKFYWGLDRFGKEHYYYYTTGLTKQYVSVLLPELYLKTGDKLIIKAFCTTPAYCAFNVNYQLLDVGEDKP